MQCNGSTTEIPHNLELPAGYDTVSIVVSKSYGIDPIEHSSSQYVQLARGNLLFARMPISAYFKATSGQFKLSLDSSKVSALYLFNIDSQPVDKLTYAEVATNYLNNIAIGMQSNGDGHIFLSLGVMGSVSILSIEVNDAVEIENFIFKFVDSNTFEVFRSATKIGSIDFGQTILPFFQTVCEIPAPDIDSFGFDLSQSYESLDYRLPNSAVDGDTYHLLTGGTLFNKELLRGDYITVYANKTNVAINRLSKIPLRKKLPIKRIANYTNLANLYAIYDEQIGLIKLEGEYHHGDLSYVGLMFSVDVSSLSNTISVKSSIVGIVAGSALAFNVELVEGQIQVSTSDTSYGQHIFIGSVIGEV